MRSGSAVEASRHAQTLVTDTGALMTHRALSQLLMQWDKWTQEQKDDVLATLLQRAWPTLQTQKN
jgi:hypothetical protein